MTPDSALESPTRARARRFAGAAVVLVLLALAGAVLVSAVTPRGETTTIASYPDPGSSTGATPGGAATIIVHVSGEVARPGVYELADGARTIDAIAAAGGLTDAADPAELNLAEPVDDGQQISVPALGETAPAAGPAPAAAGGLVDLNAADAATLETLPRIGPAIAARIVAWREEHGRFETVEDLLDVSGIGEQILEAVRDLVTT